MASMTTSDERPVVVAAPDAFKGTAPAARVADGVAAGAEAAGWACDRCPLSDGGEGFADVLAGAGVGEPGPPGAGDADPGRWAQTTVTGPLGAPVVARWYQRGTQAVMDSASASGLPLAGGAVGNDPVAATTRGTGELIVAAAAAGARRVLIGVGGSATTDGGLGAVEAIEEAGGLAGVEIVVACDVQTLFVDAARLFGPQKGASPAEVATLQRRLETLAGRYRARFGIDVTALTGAGAAGGLGGGLAALGARLVPGFDVVAEALALERRLAAADLVVTGEGRLDASSWSGKVVSGVCALGRRTGTAVLVVAGTVGPGGAVPGLEVVDLTARYGEARALADPAAWVAESVRELLVGRRP
jgi:glycerate kinase